MPDSEGYNIVLYEGGRLAKYGDSDNFFTKLCNKSGKDKHARVFKSSAYFMSFCFINAAVLFTTFALLLSHYKAERAEIDVNAAHVGDFIDWRMFLYKAEMVLTPFIALSTRL